jgi:hypothetical protein
MKRLIAALRRNDGCAPLAWLLAPALAATSFGAAPAPEVDGPWVYCVAGAGIHLNPAAGAQCEPPKTPEETQTPFPEGDDK